MAKATFQWQSFSSLKHRKRETGTETEPAVWLQHGMHRTLIDNAPFCPDYHAGHTAISYGARTRVDERQEIIEPLRR